MFGFISKKSLLARIEKLEGNDKWQDTRIKQVDDKIYSESKRVDKVVDNRDYQANLLAEKLGYTIERIPAERQFIMRELPKPVRAVRRKKKATKKKTTK
jgi:hypothetical protein